MKERTESSFTFFLNNKEEIMDKHNNRTRGQQNRNSSSQSTLEDINGVHADSAKKFIDICVSSPVQTQVVAIENAIECLEKIKASLTHQESINPFQSPSLH